MSTFVNEIDLKHAQERAAVRAAEKDYSSRIKTIGDRLRAMRLALSLTQEELARKAGTSQAIIQKIENNHSLRPRCIEEVARALYVNPAWLQYGSTYAAIKPPTEFLLKTGPSNNE